MLTISSFGLRLAALHKVTFFVYKRIKRGEIEAGYR